MEGFGRKSEAMMGLRADGKLVPARAGIVISKSGGSPGSGGRGAKNRSQHLPNQGIMAIFIKKRLHLSGGSDTIQNIRGFLWKAYKNVIQPHCRLVGGM